LQRTRRRRDRAKIPPMNIVCDLFPNLTQLDLTGPFEVFHRIPGARVHLAASTPEPVRAEGGLTILPTIAFADAPQADILCVPGGGAVGRSRGGGGVAAGASRARVRGSPRTGGPAAGRSVGRPAIRRSAPEPASKPVRGHCSQGPVRRSCADRPRVAVAARSS